jgi:hypothetical protein
LVFDSGETLIGYAAHHPPQVHIQVLFQVAVQLVEVESIGPGGLRKGWMGGLQKLTTFFG